ncbi:MAG: YfgM family protein [Gammaproteobacteria bacterium]
MAELMTEEEQIIAIKAWWNRYGWFIIGGVVAGLAIYFGWSAWQTHNQNLRAEASYNYETIADNLMAGNVQAADKQVIQNANAPLPMPYAVLEKWLLSEVDVKQEKLDQAAINLQQGLVLGSDPFFQELTSIRLARLYIAQGNPQQALDVVALKSDKNAANNPEVFLVRGDAYAALQDTASARDAYTEAWQLYPSFSPERQIISMLLAELPEENATVK